MAFFSHRKTMNANCSICFTCILKQYTGRETSEQLGNLTWLPSELRLPPWNSVWLGQIGLEVLIPAFGETIMQFGTKLGLYVAGFPTLNEPWMYQKQISFEIFSLDVSLSNFQNQIWDSSQKTLDCKIRRIKPSKQNLVTRNPANILLPLKQSHRMKLEHFWILTWVGIPQMYISKKRREQQWTCLNCRGL